MDTVDAELDRLISKRASQDRREDPDEREELWKASVRAYEEKRRQVARYAPPPPLPRGIPRGAAPFA